MSSQLTLACAVQGEDAHQVLDRGQNLFLEESQGIRFRQSRSGICMVGGRQAEWFLWQMNLRTFLGLVQAILADRPTCFQPILLRGSAKVGFLESLAFKATRQAALASAYRDAKPTFFAVGTILKLHVQHVCVHFVYPLEKRHDATFCIHAVAIELPQALRQPGTG